MTQAVEQAKQGNPEAIASLMNHQLAGIGVEAQVQREGDHLMVLLFGEPAPNRLSMVNFVRNGVEKLSLFPTIRQLSIEGYRTGASSAEWTQELELSDGGQSDESSAVPSPPLPPPPPPPFRSPLDTEDLQDFDPSMTEGSDLIDDLFSDGEMDDSDTDLLDFSGSVDDLFLDQATGDSDTDVLDFPGSTSEENLATSNIPVFEEDDFVDGMVSDLPNAFNELTESPSADSEGLTEELNLADLGIMEDEADTQLDASLDSFDSFDNDLSIASESEAATDFSFDDFEEAETELDLGSAMEMEAETDLMMKSVSESDSGWELDDVSTGMDETDDLSDLEAGLSSPFPEMDEPSFSEPGTIMGLDDFSSDSAAETNSETEPTWLDDQSDWQADDIELGSSALDDDFDFADSNEASLFDDDLDLQPTPDEGESAAVEPPEDFFLDEESSNEPDFELIESSSTDTDTNDAFEESFLGDDVAETSSAAELSDGMFDEDFSRDTSDNDAIAAADSEAFFSNSTDTDEDFLSDFPAAERLPVSPDSTETSDSDASTFDEPDAFDQEESASASERSDTETAAIAATDESDANEPESTDSETELSSGSKLLPLIAILMLIWAGGIVGYAWTNRQLQTAADTTTETQPGQSSEDPTDAPEAEAPQGFDGALSAGFEAATLAQTAQTSEDWQAVATQWETAIAALQSVPEDSENYEAAQQKIQEYQQNATVAQQNADSAPAAEATPPATEAETSDEETVASAATPASEATCQPVETTAQSPQLELTQVQIQQTGSAPPIIVGCLTNHTEQPILNVSVIYAQAVDGEQQTRLGRLVISSLESGSATRFESDFELAEGASEATIQSLRWASADGTQPQQQGVDLQISAE